ncbi:hypothetical protein [Frigoriglobus tundricola]|uniref:Uncharacterized protein n=1 Tax=Frigoriglobus tundricola TaxID=2774151 RepID=A0A6M5YMM6_9BACT|nr:hypothetical protein [Frigoriglobus tundricola]QJW95195.1 hypothetical protein FTUN_2734 [Frigoriglobus tundricola]
MTPAPDATSPPLAVPPGTVTVNNILRPAKQEQNDQIVIYGHSSLLYWWPVWLVCFILAGATYAEGDQAGGVTVSRTNVPGVVFVITLLAVAVSSTVLLRGMVSVVAAVSVVTVAVALGWFGWWGDILGFLGGLEIRINAAGYLCIGIPLFLVWALVIGVYDQMHHVTFGRGQIRYVLEVGDGEVVMPSEGAVVEKKRSDAFRHWVLGLGAGDLMIRSGGPNSPAIELKNVVRIRRKLAVIDRMLREKAVTVA